MGGEGGQAAAGSCRRRGALTRAHRGQTRRRRPARGGGLRRAAAGTQRQAPPRPPAVAAFGKAAGVRPEPEQYVAPRPRADPGAEPEGTLGERLVRLRKKPAAEWPQQAGYPAYQTMRLLERRHLPERLPWRHQRRKSQSPVHQLPALPPPRLHEWPQQGSEAARRPSRRLQPPQQRGLESRRLPRLQPPHWWLPVPLVPRQAEGG